MAGAILSHLTQEAWYEISSQQQIHGHTVEPKVCELLLPIIILPLTGMVVQQPQEELAASLVVIQGLTYMVQAEVNINSLPAALVQGGLGLSLFFYDINGAFVGTGGSSYPIAGLGISTLSTTGTAPPGSAYAAVAVNANSTGTGNLDFYLDNITLTPIGITAGAGMSLIRDSSRSTTGSSYKVTNFGYISKSRGYLFSNELFRSNTNKN